MTTWSFDMLTTNTTDTKGSKLVLVKVTEQEKTEKKVMKYQCEYSITG